MVSTINMRVFKIILVLIFAFTSLVNAVPTSFLRLEHREAEDEAPTLSLDHLEASEANSTAATTVAEEDSYDQRQNGTENYRIHVDGLVVVVAPVEALLLAAAGGSNALGDNLLSGLGSAGHDKPDVKPQEAKPTSKPVEEKPVENLKPGEAHKKSAHRPHLRLVSLLAPFLKRVGSH